MHRVLVALLIVAVSACGSENPAGTEAQSIDVRVIDDIGAPVKRTAIRVMASAESRLEGRTGNDGTAEIRVEYPGSYEVRVIPSEGYLAGTEPLLKTVTVEANGTASVTFTVHRVGTTAEPKPPEWGR